MAVSIARSSDLAEVGANAGAWTVDFNADPPGMPADLTTAPATPWVPIGAISDKGIDRTFNEKTAEIYALGQVSPYLTLVTQSVATFSFEAYEGWRDSVKSVMFRKPLTEVAADPVTGQWSFEEQGTGIVDMRSWLFAVINGESFEWFYVPRATTALTKNQTFSMDAVAAVGFEATPYPDAQGNTIYHSGKLPLGVYAA